MIQDQPVGLWAVLVLTFWSTAGILVLSRSHRQIKKVNANLCETAAQRADALAHSHDEIEQSLMRELSVQAELQNHQEALNRHAIVSVTDIAGRITYANDKFCEISGYTREELMNQPHRIVKSDEHSPEFYQDLWRTISSGEVWSGEIKNHRRNGEAYWVYATIVPFKDATQKICKYVAVRTDITSLKETEQKLEAGNDALMKALESEQRVAAKLERSMKDLKALATTDKLTGLPNRDLFLDRLNQIMKYSRRNGKKFGVLFFDLDQFKIINDSLGHDVGDSLLCKIAGVFQKELREEDTVARFGGDEFVVLLGSLNEFSDCEKIANKLLRSFATPHQIGEHQIHSNTSIGLVTNEYPYSTAGEMIRDADAAMYQAKANGKNRVVAFNRKMHEQAMERLSLESDLRIALAENQLHLVYQPIMELETGYFKGFEALLRWNHPERGFVSPDKFIPIAEDTGLIHDIGKWVLWTAADQVAQWNQNRPPTQRLCVNVNVSKLQLTAPGFLEDVLKCKSKFNLQPGDLPLEITESVIVDARSNIIPLLGELREHGFPIVMDDFGTGVSSLSTLHSFPIDVLKIDQSFVRVLDRDRSLLAVVTSIAALADNLGIQTVAEGVETAEIVAAMQSIGCTWAQGYFFAKPLSKSDAEDYIARYTQSDTNAA